MNAKESKYDLAQISLGEVLVKYRLQGTFYWVKNGKKVPIKTIEIQVKNRVAVKSASCSEIKRRSLFTGVRLFICNLNARHK